MKRQDAINLFGGSVKLTAQALNLTTQAVYSWPEVLSDAQEGKVMLALSRGAAVQRPRGLSKQKPKIRRTRARN